MRVLRVSLSSWTASFRHPSFMIGFQPTLPVPPLSTMFGLVSAAKGEYVNLSHTPIGYSFSYEGKGIDLERIFEIGPGLIPKTNILRREFLYNTRLTLYLDLNFKDSFQKPKYPLLMGRSSDLVRIDEIKEVDVKEQSGGHIGPGIFSSFPEGCKQMVICALPVYFTDEMPRKAVGSRKFFLVEEPFNTTDNYWFDEEKQMGFQLYTEDNLDLQGV